MIRIYLRDHSELIMVGRLLQNSRNVYIHIQQNIFVFKEAFFIQQLNIYGASWNSNYSTSWKQDSRR